MDFQKFIILSSAASLISLASCTEPAPKTETNPAGTTAVDTVQQLPSWQGESRERLLTWIDASTRQGSMTFIPEADRIAVFDNDGTLWPEQPVPSQLIYAIDYVKANMANKPEWQKDAVLKGLAQGDMEPLKKSGMKGLIDLFDKTHTGLAAEDFAKSVRTWADTATYPGKTQKYIEVVYQPMLELLDLLRDHQFKTFIVSGGGADFMRVWSEDVYGIPPYQVIGSYGEVKYEVVEGKPTLTKVSGSLYVDDKAGKPQAIHRFIGKVPVFCGGNSDGDQAMMQYTSSSPYTSLCMLVHHTDSIREYAYDKNTHSGHLETGLVEAQEKNWLVVDMKNEWTKVYPFEK